MLSEEPGLKVIGSASDCGGIIALIKSISPDLALIDWELPGCKMKEVLTEIKSLKLESNIILVVLGRERSVRETALQAGADEFVVIGDPPEYLLETFRRLNVPKV
jgi:DNA-binding NarL/FixJ family response regulator